MFSQFDTKTVFLVFAIILLLLIVVIGSVEEIKLFVALFDTSVLHLGFHPAPIQEFLASALSLRIGLLALYVLAMYFYLGPPKHESVMTLIVLFLLAFAINNVERMNVSNYFPINPGSRSNTDILLSPFRETYIALSNQKSKDLADTINRLITLISTPIVFKDLWKLSIPVLLLFRRLFK